MIPRILHFIWVGSPVPEPVRVRWDAWRRMHPAWTVRTWTSAAMSSTDALPATEPVLIADFLRLEKVLDYGGVYVDSDTWPLRPLDPLTGDVPTWVSTIRPGLVNNAAFGARPGDPFLEAVWEQAVYRLRNNTHRRLNYIAGPPLWTRVHRDHPDVTALPAEAFTPISHGPAARRAARDLTAVAAAYPSAYSIHEFSQAWQKGRS